MRDSFLGEEWSSALLANMVQMEQGGHFQQHKFQFGADQFAKPHIFELDLHDTGRREQSEEMSYIFDKAGPHLVKTLKAAFPRSYLNSSPSAIKMQYNSGEGGCFPYHYDNPGPPSKRKITCIVYLNPSWTEGDGGELVLCPFLGAPITIAPAMDRCVLFKSDSILHKVSLLLLLSLHVRVFMFIKMCTDEKNEHFNVYRFGYSHSLLNLLYCRGLLH
jgi:Rps23 Pro-64 3,4-dihydroxylase Tpa1-like proline 4-hydroxylase